MNKVLNLNGLLPAKIHRKLCTEIQNKDMGLPIDNYDTYLSEGIFKPNPGSSANTLIINNYRTMDSFVKSALSNNLILMPFMVGDEVDSENAALSLLLPDSDAGEFIKNPKLQHYWYSFFTKRLRNPAFLCKYDDSLIPFSSEETYTKEESAMIIADLVDEDRVKYNNILLEVTYDDENSSTYVSDIKIQKSKGKAKHLYISQEKEGQNITGVKPGDYTIVLTTNDSNNYDVSLVIDKDTVEFTRDGDSSNYISNSTVNIPDSKETLIWNFSVKSSGPVPPEPKTYNLTVDMTDYSGKGSVNIFEDNSKIDAVGNGESKAFTIDDNSRVSLELVDSAKGYYIVNDVPEQDNPKTGLWTDGTHTLSSDTTVKITDTEPTAGVNLTVRNEQSSEVTPFYYDGMGWDKLEAVKSSETKDFTLDKGTLVYLDCANPVYYYVDNVADAKNPQRHLWGEHTGEALNSDTTVEVKDK